MSRMIKHPHSKDQVKRGQSTGVKKGQTFLPPMETNWIEFKIGLEDKPKEMIVKQHVIS